MHTERMGAMDLYFLYGGTSTKFACGTARKISEKFDCIMLILYVRSKFATNLPACTTTGTGTTGTGIFTGPVTHSPPTHHSGSDSGQLRLTQTLTSLSLPLASALLSFRFQPTVRLL